MHSEQITGTPQSSLLDGLLRQTLTSLYEREVEVNLLIEYLQAAKSGVLFPQDDLRCRDFIRAADSALRAGRTGKSAFGPGFALAFRERLAERHSLEDELGKAISTKALSLVFEPIVSSSGDCRMVEALLRWNHPKRGPVSPSEFISVAERTGDILPIGRWALRESCHEAATWPGNPPPAVSVNVSPAQILAGSFVPDVFAALSESDLSPDRLQIELTENLFAGDLKSFSLELAKLRKSGVRIALDDFGTGFSSLSYLRSLPIDRIKIDQSFVQTRDEGSLSILRAIVDMAQALKLETIAEGVETTSQAQTLLSLGTDHLQGFLFAGGSLASSEIRGWLARQSQPAFIKRRGAHS